MIDRRQLRPYPSLVIPSAARDLLPPFQAAALIAIDRGRFLVASLLGMTAALNSRRLSAQV